MLTGDPKYKVKDLEVAATFISGKKELRLYLEAVKSEPMTEGGIRRVPDTGCRVKFDDYRAIIWNKAVLQKMLDHKQFNNPQFGYRIDPQDPTGFWRVNGVVEEAVVKTFIPKPNFNVTFKQLDLKNLKKKLPEHLPQLMEIDNPQLVTEEAKVAESNGVTS